MDELTGEDMDLAERFQQVLDVLGQRLNEYKRNKSWHITEENDWEDKYHIPAVLALIHSEVSEALEAFRKDDMANFKEELSDVLIRTIGLCAGMNLEIGYAVLKKMAINDQREARHGGKKL